MSRDVVSGSSTICPKCSFQASPAFLECPACGIVIQKFLGRSSGSQVLPPAAPVRASSGPSEPNRESDGTTTATGGTLYDPSEHTSAPLESRVSEAAGHARLGESRRRAIKLGLVVGAVVYFFPLTRFIFSYLLIIVHELGHTALALLYGIPAVPALDFFYGGGVSLMWDRSWLLSLTVLAGGLALLWRLRDDPRSLGLGVSVAVFWAVTFLTPLHDAVILAMGHGAELLFAGYAWHKCLTGNCRNETERWLFGACSVFVLLSSWMFGYKLLASSLFRRQYEQAKGGGHWMDFSRLADEYLHVDLSIVATSFWFLTALTPFVAYWIWLNTDDAATRRGA